MKNIVLFGFMGCGKSTVGALLAQRTGRQLLDTDGYLEAQAGRKIPEIFAADGEAAFRRMEREVCAALAGREGLVVCCGGGTVLDEENAVWLGKGGHMVFLDAGFEICYERIRESDRPLVRQNSKEALRQIYLRRQPVYRSRAAFCVDADQPPRQAAQAVLEAIGEEKA